ncbi:MAG: hypothetical protein ABI772_11285 [Bacteroidota bacterium]
MTEEFIPIELTNKSTFESLNSEFNKIFPFLKLEFFHLPHERGNGSPDKSRYTANEKIFTIGHIHGPRRIKIIKNMKVYELEKLFEVEYELHMQVFRKSGSIWLETSATDDWTLEDENEAGRNSQTVLTIERENFDDRDVE